MKLIVGLKNGMGLMWDQAWQKKIVNLENSNINYAKKEGRANKRLKKKISWTSVNYRTISHILTYNVTTIPKGEIV